MAYFSKPEKGRMPPSGFPEPGDIGIRPYNVIKPSYKEQYDLEISPYHRNFRNNLSVVEVAGGKAYAHPEHGIEFTGEVTDSYARNVDMFVNKPELGGFLARTNSRYSIYDSNLRAEGNGRNDFIGNGALLMADDDAQLLIKGCKLETTGCVRPCTAAGLRAYMKVYETSIKTNGSPFPEWYTPRFAYGEGTLGHAFEGGDDFTGMGGNCRPHMSLNDSKSYFYDCDIVSSGWAALSTDSVHGNLYLEANRCNMKVIHHGYATWADTGSRVVFNNCNIDNYSLLCAVVGEAEVLLNHCDSVSGMYGANFTTNSNDATCCLGTLRVVGGRFVTGREAVRTMSQNAYLDFDSVELVSGSGVLLRSMEAARRRRPLQSEEEEMYGVRAVYSNMDMAGDILHEDPNCTMAVSLINTHLKGTVRDAYLSLRKGSTWYATANSSVGLPADTDISKIDAPAGVTIEAVAIEDSPIVGEHTLKSGGKLIVK